MRSAQRSLGGALMEGGSDKAGFLGRWREVYVSLAVIPEGLRDVWSVPGVRWCLMCRYLYSRLS